MSKHKHCRHTSTAINWEVEATSSDATLEVLKVYEIPAYREKARAAPQELAFSKTLEAACCRRKRAVRLL